MYLYESWYSLVVDKNGVEGDCWLSESTGTEEKEESQSPSHANISKEKTLSKTRNYHTNYEPSSSLLPVLLTNFVLRLFKLNVFFLNLKSISYAFSI